MTTKPRLSNNVIAALEDIIAIHGNVWPEVKALNDAARSRMDVALLARLSIVTAGLADIRKLAVDARNGRYDGGAR